MCGKHNSPVEFLCTECFEELCGHCILEHAKHIGSIKGISDLIKQTVSEAGVRLEIFFLCAHNQVVSSEKMHDEMVKRQTSTLRNLEDLFSEFQNYFAEKQRKLKNEIIIHDRNLKRCIDEFD